MALPDPDPEVAGGLMSGFFELSAPQLSPERPDSPVGVPSGSVARPSCRRASSKVARIDRSAEQGVPLRLGQAGDGRRDALAEGR